MGAEPGRAGWLIPGAALATLLFVQALRVWFPTVLFVVGDAGSTSALVMGAFALGCLLVGPVVAIALASRAPGMLVVGSSVLAASYLAFLLTDGGLLQALTTTSAVIGGALAVTSLAAVPGSGATVRAGIVLGLAAEVTVHATLGTYTLAWQTGLAATTVSVILAISLVLVTRAALRDLRLDRAQLVSGSALPWLALAPLLLLVLVVAGAPGRVAVATGWSAPAVTATVVTGQALATLGVLVVPRIGQAIAATTGGGLALIGAAGALQASGVTSVLAQIALAVGLALVVVVEPATTTSASPRRRAGAAGAGVFGFGLLAFVYYAAYDIPLGFYNRAILLAAAVAAAILAGNAARHLTPPRLRLPLRRQRLTRVTVALVLVVAASAIARIGDPIAQPALDAPGAEIRLVLYNLHMGFDPQGRFSIDELAETIRQEDPDVVVLNEVDRGWLTTGGHDLLQLLADDLGMHHVFAPGADEVWGNALLTRFPIAELATGRLPRGNDPMPRGQLAAILDVAEGQQLGIVGTHLSHVEDQGTTRLPQARAVAATVARLRERGVPTVVMGDLNAEPDSAEIQTFGSFVRPTLRHGNPTFPSWDPQVQIDHILVSADLRVIEASVGDSQASDHLPVAVTVTIVQP